MHWRETAVLDANAVALGCLESDLMEGAARALAMETLDGLEPLAGAGEVWLLCGPGNNGGDGFAAARLLAASVEDGIHVRVLASHSEQKTETAQMMRACCTVPIHVWDDGRFSPEIPRGPRVLMLIDCLLGVGGEGPGTPATPRGSIAEVMDWLFARFEVEFPRVLACDVPTGLCSQKQMNAGRTLTFHSGKMGLYDRVGFAAPGVGGIKVAPLPWPENTTDPGPGDILRYPRPSATQKKGDRGRVLVIGGGPYHGAPLLAGQAAARMGADLVHVAMPVEAVSRATWSNELIPEEIPDVNHLSMASFDSLKERMTNGRGVQSLIIGPGMGDHVESLELVREILVVATSCIIPVVVDADALKALPEGAWLSHLNGVCTPHQKELEAWLSDLDPGVVLNNALDSTDMQRYTQHEETMAIIRTGPVDEIHGIGGRFCRAEGGSPSMAMGGTGDLLAGCIGGLLAVGMTPWPAARLASHLMRSAGVVAEEELGPGMVASDIPIFLARVLAQRLATYSE